MKKIGLGSLDLKPATTSTTLLSGAVSGDGSAVLDTANLHTSTSQSSEGALGSGTWSLGPVTSGGTQLNVQGSDSQSLKFSKEFNKKLIKLYTEVAGYKCP